MAKYIDKSAIVAEIERRIKEISKEFQESKKIQYTLLGKINALENLLPFLDTLEVKEEILDKEGKTKLMKKCVHKAYQRGYDMGVLQTTNEMNHNMKEVDLEKEYERYYEQEEKQLLLNDLKWIDMETNESHCYNCELFDSKNNVCKCIDLCKRPKSTYKGFYKKHY